MYTVILYRNGDDINVIDLDKYRFMFSSMEQDDKLVLCKESRSLNIRDLIRKIDLVVGTHYVWRLLVFDGRKRMSFCGDEFRMEELEFWELIRFYLKDAGSAIAESCECYPEEIWYMGWMERKCISEKSIKVKIKMPTSQVHNLSVFCVPVDTESEMDQRYSALMISCGLLILALNQFPIGFLSHKFLYFINLEIDRKKFADYVCSMNEVLAEIEKLRGHEQMNLQKRRRQGFPYPDRISKTDSNLPKHKVPPDIGKLKKRIRKRQSPGNVEYALNKNAYEIRSWMYYPKGIMSDAVNKISEQLDKEQQDRETLTGGFLSVDGKDKLEREKRTNLEKLSAKKKIFIDQADFEYGFRKAEDRVKKRARKQIKGGKRLVIYLLIAIVEALFVFFTVILKLPFPKAFLFGLLAFLGTPILLVLSDWVLWWHAKLQYGLYLKKNMSKKTEEKNEYLSVMLDLVAEYQYCIRVDKEQVRFALQWEEQRKNLTKHYYIYCDSKATAEKLRYLLDEEELVYPKIVPEDIDFMTEPQEVSYYWLPYKDTNCKAELNTSGYMLEGMLNFISRVWCMEDSRHII